MKKNYNFIKSRQVYGKNSVASQDIIEMLKKDLSNNIEMHNNKEDNNLLVNNETFNTLSVDINASEENIEDTSNTYFSDTYSDIVTPIIDDTAPQSIYTDIKIESNNNFLNTTNIEDIINIINEDNSCNTNFQNYTLESEVTQIKDTYSENDIIIEDTNQSENDVIIENTNQSENDVIIENTNQSENDVIIENTNQSENETIVEDTNPLENDVTEENNNQSKNKTIKDESLSDIDIDDIYLNNLINVIDEIPSENLKEFTNSIDTLETSNTDAEIDISDTKDFITDQSGNISEIQKYLIDLYTQNINEETTLQEQNNKYTNDSEHNFIDNFLNEEINDKKDFEDNNVLLISEKKEKVFLPYTINDLEYYLKAFPNKYTDYEDVIKNEFILPLKYFQGAFCFTARFREAYALSKYREGKTTVESLLFASKLIRRTDLHPAIIAACKSEKVLNNYINKLDSNKLSEFKDFEIEFKINPALNNNI